MQDLYEKLSFLAASFRSTLKRRYLGTLAAGIVLVAASAFFAGCGGANGGAPPGPPSAPSISSINNATEPSSQINLPIQLSGSSFQGSPGQVVFSQTSTGITATVTPNSTAWKDTGIVVNVPSGDGTHSFTVPGDVNVQVTTSAGTSNSMSLTLDPVLNYNANSVVWILSASPLPSTLTGMAAVAVPSSNTQAFVVVTGGFDGSSNLTQVLSNTINTSGQVGPAWRTIPTNPLPQSVAYHAMVEADAGNSPVPSGSHFIYVIGGQISFGDTPGGTTNIYRASVDPNSGAVGVWTLMASPLPVSLVGTAAVLYNGYIYLVGGLHSDSTPSNIIYSAPVNPDGTLGRWTPSPNNYPLAISFATAFIYAGRLYVLGGDTASSVAPNAQGNTGVNNVNFATVLNGAIGPWIPTLPTITNRKKAVTWTSSGTVIDAEGVYGANPGAYEVEYSTIRADGTLAPWLSVPSSGNINANVYNAAAITSPLVSPTSTPRFILLGGQYFTTFTQSTLSNEVYYNNNP